MDRPPGMRLALMLNTRAVPVFSFRKARMRSAYPSRMPGEESVEPSSTAIISVWGCVWSGRGGALVEVRSGVVCGDYDKAFRGTASCMARLGGPRGRAPHGRGRLRAAGCGLARCGMRRGHAPHGMGRRLLAVRGPRQSAPARVRADGQARSPLPPRMRASGELFGL